MSGEPIPIIQVKVKEEPDGSAYNIIAVDGIEFAEHRMSYASALAAAGFLRHMAAKGWEFNFVYKPEG